VKKNSIVKSSILLFAMLFSACESEQKNVTQSVEFMGMDAPMSLSEMSKSYSDAKIRVFSSETHFKEYPLSYETLFGVQDRVGSNEYPAGQLYNYKMKPLSDMNGNPLVAEAPDANSLLNVEGKLFLVTHLEYDPILGDGVTAYKSSDWYSRSPMGMMLSSLKQDESGVLRAVENRPIDFSTLNGLWIPCFGSQTPWNTHLGSEEDYDLYFQAGVDTKKTTDGLKAMNELYFDGDKEAKAYHYGYITEVEIEKEGSYKITKHYSMGRATREMSKIMPDKKTAYFGDDGTNVGIVMYIADDEGDLSSGTLYASKWIQESSVGSNDGGKAKLSWIKLAHATDKEVYAWANKYTFEDIFEYKTKDEIEKNGGVLPEGFKALRMGHGEIEYLKLKSDKEQIASFLETRRYSAWVGATTEFNKMEGIAINDKDKKLYMAMSYLENGMQEDKSLPKDDIKIAKNSCGATYELNLQSGVKDSEGSTIDSDYVAVDMRVSDGLFGKAIGVDNNGNTCDVNSVANSDNIFFSEKMRTLFIGEDSSHHTNNFLWAYNVDTKKLSRILSAPAGAEVTGLQVVENLNGHTYIMSNAQHLGDFTPTTPQSLREKLSARIDKFHAPVGYIKGIPELK